MPNFTVIKRTIEKQAEALAAGAKHQRLVLDKALEAFIAMDSQGQIVEWNQQAEITFGWRRREVMGRLLADTIIPQRYREAHNRGLKHFLETGKGPVLNRRFEIFACDSSGREIPVELTITPIEFDGKFVFNAFLHDITAAKRLERLRETQLRLTRLLTERQSIGDIAPRLLEAICEGIGWDIGELWWEEKDGDCLECKAIWCLQEHNISEFVAVSRKMKFARGSGLPGKVWKTGDSLWISDISQDQNFPRARVALEAGIRAAFSIPIKVGEMTHGVAAFYSRENQEPDAPLLELAADLGSRVGLFAQRREAEDELQRFSRDLERRVAERTQALEEANKKLASESAEREKLYVQAQRANRLKDEFLATVSHELRTPMNVILGWTEMMRSGEEVNDQKMILETIYRNSKALTGIIDDLLDVSRIISGKLELSVKTVELSEIVEDVTRGMRLACESKGVSMRTVLDPSVGPISGDPGRLHQVVWNLMSNAVKFTAKGGAVKLELRRVQSSVELTVRDSGVGILPEFIPYVFDRFRQEDSTSTRRYGGLGIGLAITRQIVELHGGHISVSSDGKGKGSTFTVTLPLMAVRLMPAQDKNTAATAEAASWCPISA